MQSQTHRSLLVPRPFVEIATGGVLTLAGCYGGLDYGQSGDLPSASSASGGGDGQGDGDGDGGTGSADSDASGGVSGGSSADGDESGGPSGEPACDQPNTGHSPLRRMTREQYDNTVRDLVGITSKPASAFSPDEKIGAFFSNGIAPVGDLIVEQYMNAADAIATEVVADMDALLPCDPALDGEDACAAEFVSTFGLRAYRRPLSPDEADRLQTVYAAGRQSGGFVDGIRLVIQAVLQSPNFLYYIEFGTPSGSELAALDSWELASRLSYFLWNSMPDETLFSAAQANILGSPDELEAQARRMLDDPKAERAIASFHLQWLVLDKLEHLDKDPEVYPAYSDTLRDAMRAETAKFSDFVVREGDGKLSTLLTATFTFADAPLLDLYGVSAPAGPEGRVELNAGQRAGLLTQASVMAAHAHANQSSPIHRGKLVRENFLCQPLPPPPPDVDNTAPDPDPSASTRERFAEHTANPECASCHSLIDPLGFGFEHYDGVGAFRSMDGDFPVDASGEVRGTVDIDGPYNGAVELAAKLAQSEQVRECVTSQWFRFAFGRIDTDEDACSHAQAHALFAASDYDIRELLVALTRTDSFRYRKVGTETTVETEDR